MPNLLGLAGGQAQKQTRFAPIYNGRWSSGIWTNRSPLRDANTTRLTEKYYGASGDALIAGSNVEITNRLTLARRPGNSVFDSNTWNSVDRFYDFRLFSLTQEEILIMVDQAAALFSLFQGKQTLVWTKSPGAGSSYMQSVGNSLYFGNGVDNKKWLQTLIVWQAGFNWTNSPTFTTFLIDPNGNIQQLTVAGISGGTQPSWSTQQPNAGNHFTGGTTTDGSSVWTNRGNPFENWGIAPPTGVVMPTVGGSSLSWQPSTYYSLPGVLLDSNGNLQKVTTAGKTAGAAPTWHTTVGSTTTSGTAVFTLIELAASLVWQPNTAYPNGQFVIGTATGTPCLFQLATGSALALNSNVAAHIFPPGPVDGVVFLTFPTSLGSATFNFTTLSSLSMIGIPLSTGANQSWNNLNGAGAITGTTQPFPSTSSGPVNEFYQMVVLGSFNIPTPGQYAFNIISHDAMLWGIGNGAQFVSGPNVPPSGGGTNPTQTAVQGFPVLGGNNNRFEAGGESNNSFVVNFPTAGTYNYEIDYAYWMHSGQTLQVTANGQTIPFGSATSGATQPIWPAFTTAFAPAYPTVSESAGQFVWSNLGPITDFTFLPNINYTLPDNTIIDVNGFTEGPYRTGATGTTMPTFTTALNGLTLDNPNLIWINQGAATQPPAGSLSTFNGGWSYVIALVNTLDNTVSNATQLSIPTGNFIGAAGVVIPPGSGLGNISAIDPQADYVAVFRTTDGEATPFLIPGTNTIYTVPLSTYITSGYTDTTPDTGLNNLIEAPIGGENTPPAIGAINLTFHLNRIFYSIGNTVFWTAGPDTPIGNGVNGTPPLNFDTFPSLVKRMVPTTSGLMVFTVSDVYLIQGSGTSSSPITSAIPIMTGIGLLSYDALDINGSIIGFFTTDSEFVIIDPAAGVTDAGFPIGDQFRLNNGEIGTSWNPANVFVAWHVDGEDKQWIVSDGQNGWYRLIPTPSPESGYTWSPFATIQGGCKAVSSIEVTPGVHRLLLGPVTTGPLLNRDLDASQDNGMSYPANAVIGSAVLAQPGQVAVVSFIVTDSVNVGGTPLTLGVLIDEALPYFTGSFDILKEYVADPPTLAPSRSIPSQRFYLSDNDSGAVCRHIQMKVIWATENAPNELLTLTVFGAYFQEN
jgi:hypothetical protein